MNATDADAAVAYSTSSRYVRCIKISPFKFNIYRAAQAHAIPLLP